MANKLRLVTENYVDYSYMTCTTQASITGLAPEEILLVAKDLETLPVTNIRNISKSKVLRTEDAAAMSINLVLDTFYTVNCVVFNGHNFTVDTEIDIYLYSDDDFTTQIGTTSYTVTADNDATNYTLTQPNLPIWFSNVTNVHSIRIFLTNGITSPLSYFQVSRLLVSEYIEAAINVSLGHSISWKDRTKQYRTEQGTLGSITYKPVKYFSFNLEGMSETKRSIIQRALANVGLERDFFMSMYPDSTNQKARDYMGLVKQTKVPTQVEYAQNIYRSTYEFEEI